MILSRKDLQPYIDFAAEQFKTAANNGAETPEGICVVTLDGIKFGGHSYNDTISAGANALSVLKNHVEARVREDLKPKFEIATVVLVTSLDEKTKQPTAPQENTLKDLAEYIGTQDGQIIYVTSPNHDDILTLKL